MAAAVVAIAIVTAIVTTIVATAAIAVTIIARFTGRGVVYFRCYGIAVSHDSVG